MNNNNKLLSVINHEFNVFLSNDYNSTGLNNVTDIMSDDKTIFVRDVKNHCGLNCLNTLSTIRPNNLIHDSLTQNISTNVSYQNEGHKTYNPMYSIDAMTQSLTHKHFPKTF